MDGGVKVRYIFMPLKGQGDYRTTVSVWCAKDQNEALDLAKSGAELEPKDCENPIDEHLNISRNLGVRGTPAIILQDGSMLPGYVPASKLIAELFSPCAIFVRLIMLNHTLQFIFNRLKCSIWETEHHLPGRTIYFQLTTLNIYT